MTIDNQIRAADVMTSQVVTIPESTSVLEATRIFLEHNISGAPVVNRIDRMVGVLSEEDLLAVFFEEGENLDEVEVGTCSVLGATLVTRRVVSVKPETPARTIARTMMMRKIKRLPVLDDDRKVVGVVSRKDLLRAMWNRDGGEEQEQEEAPAPMPVSESSEDE